MHLAQRLALVGAVFRSEIRSGLRDRHVVVYSLVVPIFLYPAIFWIMAQGFQYREGALEKQVSRIAWEGGAMLPAFFARIERDPHFLPMEIADPPTALIEGELDAFLVVQVGESGRPRLEASFDLSKDRSAVTQARLQELWGGFREEALAESLAAHGVARGSMEIIDLQSENVASPEEMGRFLLSVMLPVILVIIVSMGAMYPAIDALVGEKERGTLESILAAGAPRLSIVTGKFLAVVAASMSALIVNLGSMLLTLHHQAELFSATEPLAIGVPWSAIPVILAAGLLLAAFFSASMILIASCARTFKEGQSYITPFYLLCIIPALAGSMPGLELTPATALIPVTNVALLFQTVLTDAFPILPILIVFVSLIAYVVIVLWIAKKVFGREDFLFGGGVNIRRFFTLPGLSGRRA